MAMIELTDICRLYQVGDQTIHALWHLNLTIPEGDYLAIMGPSGSGKSTLLNVLGCLDTPTSGTYILDGEDVSTFSEKRLTQVRRHKIGFVFQSFHLVPRLTARENVEIPLVFAGVDPLERKERALAALQRVGLEDRANHKPNELSGGQMQRVAIARAVVTQPAILLADEPTGNLDTASGQEIMALLEEMNDEGLTLLTVTHDPDIGGRAKRLVTLVDGSVKNIVERAR